MTGISTVRIRRASYENIVADCPLCGSENIFNRVSDLKTSEQIAGLDVSCQKCRKAFHIVGDSINNRHELLIYDCDQLIEHKRYINSILNLAQAYEVFFSLYFRVELLFKPFALDPDHDIEQLNRLAGILYDSIKAYTFRRLRSSFLQHILRGHSPRNWKEAADDLAVLSQKSAEPKDDSIEASGDAKLVTLLKAVKNTRIHELRNRAVHHRAYRPTLNEVNDALDETKNTLLPLTHHLQLNENVNWYLYR